jgi:hypothetical protein
MISIAEDVSVSVILLTLPSITSTSPLITLPSTGRTMVPSTVNDFILLLFQSVSAKITKEQTRMVAKKTSCSKGSETPLRRNRETISV